MNQQKKSIRAEIDTLLAPADALQIGVSPRHRYVVVLPYISTMPQLAALADFDLTRLPVPTDAWDTMALPPTIELQPFAESIRSRLRDWLIAAFPETTFAVAIARAELKTEGLSPDWFEALPPEVRNEMTTSAADFWYQNDLVAES